MINVQCPQCGKQLAIPEQYAGQRGRCNGCGSEIIVPLLQAGPPPLNAAEPPVAAPPVAYAGFWRRVLAYMIDMCVLSVPNFLVAFFVVVPLMNYLNGVIASRIMPEYQVLVSGAAESGIYTTMLFLIAWPYFAAMEGSRLRATLGKMAVGISVVTTSGTRISVLRAIWRYFMKLFSGLLLSIGYFMVAFTSKKQGLHDKASRTLVIVTAPKPALWARLAVVGVSVALLVVSSVVGVLAANAIDSTTTGKQTASVDRTENASANTMRGDDTAQAAVPDQTDLTPPVTGTPLPLTLMNFQRLERGMKEVLPAVAQQYRGYEDIDMKFIAYAQALQNQGYSYDATVYWAAETEIAIAAGKAVEGEPRFFLPLPFREQDRLLKLGLITRATKAKLNDPVVVASLQNLMDSGWRF